MGVGMAEVGDWTLCLDYDPAVFLAVPRLDELGSRFPDLEAWSRTAARALFGEPLPPEPQLERWAWAIAQVAALEPEPELAADQKYLHAPGPDVVPIPVFVLVWSALGLEPAQLEQALRHVAGLDESASVVAPAAATVEVPGIGTGIRVGPYVHAGEGRATVRYALHVPVAGRILELRASSHDLNRLASAVPDLDGLVQSVRLEQDAGGPT